MIDFMSFLIALVIRKEREIDFWTRLEKASTWNREREEELRAREK